MGHIPSATVTTAPIAATVRYRCCRVFISDPPHLTYCHFPGRLKAGASPCSSRHARHFAEACQVGCRDHMPTIEHPNAPGSADLPRECVSASYRPRTTWNPTGPKNSASGMSSKPAVTSAVARGRRRAPSELSTVGSAQAGIRFLPQADHVAVPQRTECTYAVHHPPGCFGPSRADRRQRLRSHLGMGVDETGDRRRGGRPGSGFQGTKPSGQQGQGQRLDGGPAACGLLRSVPTCQLRLIVLTYWQVEFHLSGESAHASHGSQRQPSSRPHGRRGHRHPVHPVLDRRSLEVGAPTPELSASGPQIVHEIAGHGGAVAAQFALTEGVPTLGLVVISLSLARAAARSGAGAAARYAGVAGAAAAAISLMQFALGEALARTANADNAHLFYEAVNRADGVKMFALAVVGAAGATSGVLPRWLRYVAIALTIAIVASGYRLPPARIEPGCLGLCVGPAVVDLHNRRRHHARRCEAVGRATHRTDSRPHRRGSSCRRRWCRHRGAHPLRGCATLRRLTARAVQTRERVGRGEA